MNDLIKVLRKLKSGKLVCIPDLTQRYSLMGVLDAFEIKITQDGSFISLVEESK